MTAPRNDLEALERFVFETVTAPGGVDSRDGGAIAARILPSRRLAPDERLQIYARMYWRRLLSVLESDFPALRRLLGSERFDSLCRRFLVERPPRHYSLNPLGRGLPPFLESLLGRDDPAVELARLEALDSEVYEAPDDDVLTADQLLAVGSEERLQVRFAVVRSARVARFDHDVLSFALGVQRGEDPSPPARQPCAVLVQRSGTRILRRRLDPMEARLLEEIGRHPLGEAISRLLEDGAVDLDTLSARLGGWFRRWAEWGVLAKR